MDKRDAADRAVVAAFLRFVLCTCRHGSARGEQLTFRQLRTAFQRAERQMGREHGFLTLRTSQRMVVALLSARFGGRTPERKQSKKSLLWYWRLTPKYPERHYWREHTDTEAQQ